MTPGENSLSVDRLELHAIPHERVRERPEGNWKVTEKPGGKT